MFYIQLHSPFSILEDKTMKDAAKFLAQTLAAKHVVFESGLSDERVENLCRRLLQNEVVQAERLFEIGGLTCYDSAGCAIARVGDHMLTVWIGKYPDKK